MVFYQIDLFAFTTHAPRTVTLHAPATVLRYKILGSDFFLVYIRIYFKSIPLVKSFFLWFLLGSVAVMTKAYPNEDRSDLILLQDIASYLLLACGLIYIISVSLENFGC